MKNFEEKDQSYYAYKEITENPIVIDFEGCKYLGVVHKILKEAFGLPEYYGENWDALWDCLRGLFYKRGDWLVEIYGFYDLPEDVRKACKIMLEVFDDVHEDTPNITFKVIS